MSQLCEKSTASSAMAGSKKEGHFRESFVAHRDIFVRVEVAQVAEVAGRFVVLALVLEHFFVGGSVDNDGVVVVIIVVIVVVVEASSWSWDWSPRKSPLGFGIWQSGLGEEEGCRLTQ
ncbi:hypothetical protein EDD21DRAFT_356871 [Dissophora ornata]|nr:hypothetical protein EDD21DRAFT_356871 [Dissophora ornata]